ncbi:hypothetical protein Scep_004615 [Stephania cephalantha]|uniref:Uncharacterized protein n=1 Tax=Stephania cephalantha TaxID=152367 RepID=A0AAP0KT17_9MAGN
MQTQILWDMQDHTLTQDQLREVQGQLHRIEQALVDRLEISFAPAHPRDVRADDSETDDDLDKRASFPSVRVICIVNARGKLKNPPLPAGYYRTRSCSPVAVGAAGEVRAWGAGVRGGEGEEGEGGGDGGVREVGGEYDGGEGEASLRGGEDVLGVGRDQGGVGEVDFGWGKAVYGGPTKGGGGDTGVASFYIPSAAAVHPPPIAAALETIVVSLFRPLCRGVMQLPPHCFAALRRCSSLPSEDTVGA